MRSVSQYLAIVAALVSFADFAQAQSSSRGQASYYSHAGRTANGETFRPGDLTAAHRNLPFGTRVRVINVRSGHSVVVRINDRGPFVRGRIIDVSRGAASALGMIGRGIAQVEIQVLR
ncbi:MAG: septal ring lytic transglycosylase RlpA family protein [Xanthobacteraceae bacterium]